VPDGKITTKTTSAAGLYDAALAFSAEQTGGLVYRGAAREEAQASGGMALWLGAAGLSQKAIANFQTLAKAFTNPKATAKAYTVSPNVDSNVFITTPKTAGAKLDSIVSTVSSSARIITDGEVNAAARKKLLSSEARITATHGTVDGLWLVAKSDLEWRTLGVDDHTPVTLRIVIGTRPASPMAIDLTFNGTLSITGVTSGPVLTGTLNGIATIGMLKENQADQQTTETLVTERFNWPVTITYNDAGNGVTSTIALDLAIGGTAASDTGDQTSRFRLRFLKTTGGAGAPIAYSLALVSAATLDETISAVGLSTNALTLGRLRLVPDADVVDPSNAFHHYADSGLDIVQAALAVSEPNIEANAENILFPPQPAATRELTIEAVRDWVAVVRRRERRCASAELPPPPAPPRTYRVLNLTEKTPEEAKTTAAALAARLHDATEAAPTIQQLLLADERKDNVQLLVKFAGGTANAQSDLAAAESDWQTFNPGDTIFYAAIGAVGESDATLQLKRIGTFETAIAGDSRETPATTEDTIIPYPQAAVPPNADGIMVFVTVPGGVTTRKALVIYGSEDKGTDGREHFLQPSVGTAAPPSPSVTVTFADDVPQGNVLATFLGTTLPANSAVTAVTLATTNAAPDDGASDRMQAVIKALTVAGRPAPSADRQFVQQINAHDMTELKRVNYDATSFDEVIFLESNGGGS
jgi:hypothetical protein